MLDVQAGVEIYIAAWAGPSFANTHTHARVNTCLQLLSELCDTVALTRTDASTILGAKQHSQSTTAGIEPRSDNDAMRKHHVAAMRRYAFFQAPLMKNHAYRNECMALSHASAGYAKRNKVSMKQVLQPRPYEWNPCKPL